MYFIINGYDFKDEKALERRMQARDAHMEGVKALHEAGNFLFAGAMLSEAGQMCGSTIFAEFENREAVDAYLKKEPYIQSKVWDKVEVIESKIPLFFLK